MTIFELIRKDHDYQRELLEKLVNTSGETEERMRLFLALKSELIIHENVEEKNFYNPLINVDNGAREMARHGIAEHHEIDELLETLTNTSYDSTSWLTYAKQLKHKVEHHLEDEEQGYFQRAGEIFSDKQKEEISRAYTEDLEQLREDANVVVHK